jgi:hypothetical protein
MTAGKPKDRLAKRGKNLDPQHLLWENGKFTIFHGKKKHFSLGKTMGKKPPFLGWRKPMASYVVGPRPVAERESWELSCCPSGVQVFLALENPEIHFYLSIGGSHCDTNVSFLSVNLPTKQVIQLD